MTNGTEWGADTNMIDSYTKQRCKWLQSHIDRELCCGVLRVRRFASHKSQIRNVLVRPQCVHQFAVIIITARLTFRSHRGQYVPKQQVQINVFSHHGREGYAHRAYTGTITASIEGWRSFAGYKRAAAEFVRIGLASCYLKGFVVTTEWKQFIAEEQGVQCARSELCWYFPHYLPLCHSINSSLKTGSIGDTCACPIHTHWLATFEPVLDTLQRTASHQQQRTK